MPENNIPSRQRFTETILELAKKDKDIIVVTTDARGSVTLGYFAKELPKQFVEAGIAEQNSVGMSSGLSMAGKKVFLCGPACFFITRSLEQIKIDIAYSKNRINIIGVSGGVSYGMLGPTHYSITDIATIRPLPDIHIIFPCDIHQTKKLTELLVDYEYPVYVRMGRNAVPNVYENDNFEFKIGKANILTDGNDVTLIGTGETVYHCFKACQLLKKEGINARVIDMHTLKPIDKEVIIQAAKETGKIITVEEHSIYGGLGSIVTEIVSQNCPVPVKILGILDEDIILAKPKEIFNHYKIEVFGIFEETLKFLKSF